MSLGIYILNSLVSIGMAGEACLLIGSPIANISLGSSDETNRPFPLQTGSPRCVGFLKVASCSFCFA